MSTLKRMAPLEKTFLSTEIVLATLFLALACNSFGAAASDVSDCSYSAEGEIFQDQIITVNDQYQGTITRAFDYYVPPALNPPQPSNQIPLVFILHGFTRAKEYILGTAQARNGAYPWCRMMEYADQEDFIICAPNGLIGPLGVRGWNDCRDAPNQHPLVDDVQFVHNIVDWFFQQGYNVDANRIYAAGTSNGGGMALRLAAELYYKIAAAASVLSTLPEETTAQCHVPLADVGVLMMNGTDDPLVSFEAMKTGLEYWLTFNNINSIPEYVRLPDNGWQQPELTWRNVYTDGYVFFDDTSDILSTAEVYIVHLGGHYEPSITEQYRHFGNMGEMFLGTQCHDFEIAQVVCDFFKAHILQGELIYQPISVQSLASGSASGTVSDVWVAERSGTNEGMYCTPSEAGVVALAAKFTNTCNLDNIEGIDSLRIKVDCSTTIPAFRALYLYRFAGEVPGWEQVYITPQPEHGPGVLQHTVIHDLSGIRGPQNEVMIGISSRSDNNHHHDLCIDYLEIGMTPATGQ